MTNLKKIIDEKGVQQRWLAEQVGVTEVSMSRYVSGKRIPKAPLAIRIADALGVDVKELYEWESEKRTEERTETRACDLIDRRAAIDAINGLIDRFERILAGIRETSVDESVCGLCEYDGAFMGGSGNWFECPGFDEDNCFKLSDSCRERWLNSVKLPSAQPDLDEWCNTCREYDTERHCCPRFNRVIREALKEAQPEVIHCRDCRYENMGECEHKFGLLVANEENYCSYAERREE